MRRFAPWVALVLLSGCGQDLDPTGVTGSGTLVVRADIGGWALPGVVFDVVGPTGPSILTSDDEGVALAEGVIPGDYTIRARTLDADARLDQESVAILVRPEAADTAVLTGHFDPGRFARVAAANAVVCALNETGNAYCWGLGEAGELGNGTLGRSAIPLRVRAPERLTSLSAGSLHVCATGESGAAYCWGLNASGRLGTGLTSDEVRLLPLPTPVAGDQRYSSVVAGGSFACGLEAGSGRAWCWGSAFQGQLGNGARSGSSPRPVAVETEARFVSLSASEVWAGSSSVAGRTADGRVFVWGASPANNPSWLAFSGATPVEVPLPGPARAATTVCAQLETGVVCWPDLTGSVPDEVLDVLLPTPSPGVWSYTTEPLDPVFFEGGFHCRRGGSTYACTEAWAFDLPTLDLGGERAVHVSSVGRGGCAVTEAGRVWCWGGDFFQARLAAGPGAD